MDLVKQLQTDMQNATLVNKFFTILTSKPNPISFAEAINIIRTNKLVLKENLLSLDDMKNSILFIKKEYYQKTTAEEEGFFPVEKRIFEKTVDDVKIQYTFEFPIISLNLWNLWTTKWVPFIQTHRLIRLQWINHFKTSIQNRLTLMTGKMHRDVDILQIVRLIGPKPLGQGKYGTVWRALWYRMEYNIIPFACKIQYYTDIQYYKDIYEPEFRCNEATNSLVSSGTSPHFPYYFGKILGTGVSNNKPIYSIYSFYELGDGDLESMITPSDPLFRMEYFTPKYLFGIFIQILSGLVAAGKAFGLTNNDLFFRNILWNRLESSQEFQLKIDDYPAPEVESSEMFQERPAKRQKIETVSTKPKILSVNMNILIKISDMGFCSKNDNKRLFPPDQKCALNTFINTPYKMTCHVIDVPEFKPHARDLFSVIHNFLLVLANQKGTVFDTLITFFENVRNLLIEAVMSPNEYNFDEFSSLEKFIRVILFDPKNSSFYNENFGVYYS